MSESSASGSAQIPTVKLFTADYSELLVSSDVDVVYVAVPHNLHEKIYLDVLKAGKDLLAEKPFGIDLKAARAIARCGEILRALRPLQLGISFFSWSAARLSVGARGRPRQTA